MNDNGNAEPKKATNWQNTHTVWSTCGVDLPAKMDDRNAHFLSELKLVSYMVQGAVSVNHADRSRTQTPKKLSNQCRSLSSALCQIDDITLARLAGSTTKQIRKYLNETVLRLIQLESLLENTTEPKLPRKRKHELNDMAIIRLADIFELHAKANASVSKHWEESTRSGLFVKFVLKFYELFLPKFASSVNGRSIQASLEKRTTWANTPEQNT